MKLTSTLLKFSEKIQPFLPKFSKTHSSYQLVVNQGPAWPNHLFYIHLITNAMKYFINTNKVYYLYYTYAEIFKIKNVVIEWIKLIILKKNKKATQ